VSGGRLFPRPEVILFVSLFPAVMAIGACAHRQAFPPPRLVVSASAQGRGRPYGESGGRPVQHLAGTAERDTYGWRYTDPVMLGGYDLDPAQDESELRQIRFLNSLWGPGGETVFYERVGTCCPFLFFGAPLDKGVLDIYALTWEGSGEPRHLYLDRYRTGPLLIPIGLTCRVPPDR
jgi:hypothetical protein